LGWKKKRKKTARKEDLKRRAAQAARYNAGMDEKELAKQLEREGFGHTYVWQDGPDAFYPEHPHETETAHVILSGELTMTMDADLRHTGPAHVAMFQPGPRIRPRSGPEAAAI
jgi:mannose-6-phosphate isomerase-like protein (cupin superfamily)